MVDPKRMTDRSRQVMTLAESQARRLGHVTVEPEHVLLGLAEERKGVAGNVLKNLGATYKRLEESIATSSPEPVNVPTWSAATDHLIEAAMEEARCLNHGYIGTEHLLLAVCCVAEGNTQRLLEKCGIDPAEVRLEVFNLLGYGTRILP